MKTFWDKVAIIPEHTCWEWIAYKQEHGYGKIRYKGKSQRAHRVSYELVYGPIPKGYLVCHRCDNPGCVRPDHLFLGTYKDNSQDMSAKGRTKATFTKGKLDPRSNGGKWNTLKTTCPKGHAYTLENTAIYQNKRNCKKCMALRTRRYRENKSGGIKFNNAS